MKLYGFAATQSSLLPFVPSIRSNIWRKKSKFELVGRAIQGSMAVSHDSSSWTLKGIVFLLAPIGSVLT
jgi:hypothetical protein